MDIFSVHALAGMVGLIMTGFFAQSSVAANDGYLEIEGGWMDQNWKQMYKQIAVSITALCNILLLTLQWIAVSTAWIFTVTYAIMFVINLIPGCHFRSTEEAEIVGMDDVELGEYVVDYAYHERDLEGNYEPDLKLPTRAPTPNRGPFASSKKSSPDSTPDVRTHTQAAPEFEPSSSHSLSVQEQGGIRARSQSRGRGLRMSQGEDVEMVDVDMAALRRAEAKIAAQQEENARRNEFVR